MKKKFSKKDKIGVIMIVITIVVLAIPLVLKTQLSNKQPLDEVTLCPPEGEIHRTTVLIDKSDTWGADDVNRVQTLLSGVYEGIPAQGRLTIYGIIGDKRKTTEVKRFLDLCNPGSEKECNALYQNCNRVKKRFESAFSEPLRQLAEELKMPGQSSYSPLLESVSQIVDEAGGTPLEIYMVSDMMENHYKFRYYDVVPLAEEMIKEYPLSDHGVISVNIRYIQRSRHSKELERAVLKVWGGYFKQQDIAVTFDRLFVAD